jgi:hypothetical protein
MPPSIDNGGCEAVPTPFRRFVLGAVLALYGVTTGHAQEALPVPPATAAEAEGPVKTGKERLSDKASDEQRVDNCKVPPERQGPTPRPSACKPDASAILTN